MLRRLLLLCIVTVTSIWIESDASVAQFTLEEASHNFRRNVSFQDVKNYIQPIIYQKLLRSPKDSATIQQAKILVSELIVDSLLESVRTSPIIYDPNRSPDFARQVSNASVVNTATTRPTNVINVISGGLNITRPRPTQQHVINQVDRIIDSVNGGNITGIVDQALRIRAPPGVQQLVNGILNLVLCNPVNRLWNRCYGGGSLIEGLGGR